MKLIDYQMGSPSDLLYDDHAGEGKIQVIDRAASLLRLLSGAGEAGLTLSALAEESRLNTATCHRILAALSQHGLVTRAAGGRRYRLGFTFFVLGHRAAEGTGLRRICRPVLTRLCAETGDTAFLMVRHNFQSICVDRRDGATLIQTVTGGIGGAAPLGIGPGSQAILAFLGADEIETILRHNAASFTAFQNHSFKSITESLKETRHYGYAQDLDTIIPGISGVAMPIRNPSGEAVASLGLGMLTSRLDATRLPRLVARLRIEVTALEAELNPLAEWFGREI